MVLTTERLLLEPITLPLVEAMLAGDRRAAEAAANAQLPELWPGAALVERAFPAALERIRADPETRLWGDRLLLLRQPAPDSASSEPRRQVIGSVVFHGHPRDTDGVAEVGYGVEPCSQGLGLATEGTQACVKWALTQPGVHAVRATTFTWHRASLRVIEKLGMVQVDTREHDLLGEMLVFEVRREKMVK